MKPRYVTSILLLVTLVVSSIFVEKSKASTPTIYVDPATKTVQVGEQFTIDINLDYASNLYGYEVWLSFDNSKLNATAINYQGYLNEPHMVWYQEVNNTGGYVALAVSSQYPAKGKTGGSPPPLARVYLKSIENGTSPLHLYKTILADDKGMSIAHQTVDGTVHVGPTARDVAVTRITPYSNMAFPTEVKPFYINVTVKNNGTEMESFNVTVYYNSTVIDTQTVTSLAPGVETTLTFQWQPHLPGYPDTPPAAWPYPIFIISANASFVPDEINTTNNHLSDGAVTVRWPGDADREAHGMIGDGHVNLVDLSAMASHWFSIPTYHQAVDFNMDGFINLSDLSILADNWFKGPLD